MIETRVGRVVLSGLIAGLLINVGELVLNAFLLRAAWATTLQSLGRPPLGAGAIAALDALTLALGVAAMALYAAFRAHADTFRGAALQAAAAAWLLAYALGFGWSFALGLIPASIYLPTLAWSFLEIVIGTLAGARLYERWAAASPEAPAASR